MTLSQIDQIFYVSLHQLMDISFLRYLTVLIFVTLIKVIQGHLMTLPPVGEYLILPLPTDSY